VPLRPADKSLQEEATMQRGGKKYRKSEFKFIITLEFIVVWAGWFFSPWLKPELFCSPATPHLFWGLVLFGVVSYILVLFNSFEQSQDNIAKAIGFGGGAFALALAALVMSADNWAAVIMPFVAAPDIQCCRKIFAPPLVTIGVVNLFNMFLAFRTEEIITGSAGQEISR
jgi:hypothetical protein